METKDSMLKKIQMYGFSLYDINLYLDTHRTCPSGLAYFRKYKGLYDEAVKAYNEAYGPLTAEQSKGDAAWEWTEGPWPWEKEAN
mgnify:CR=1 FL=1